MEHCSASLSCVLPGRWEFGSVVRVLVAGDGGYIGAVLVPFLRTAGHEVDGLDLGLYEGCDLGPALPDTRARRPADMRDVMAAQLVGYDAVLCLAALPNDLLGDLIRRRHTR
jgi:nucleoside-diphosphate-sugar epimerase